MNKEKILSFLKGKVFSSIVTGVVCFTIGIAVKGSIDFKEMEKVKKEYEVEYEKVDSRRIELEGKTRDLQAKVHVASPWFNMDEAEKEAFRLETLAKEEENKKEKVRLEEEKKAEEERLANEKKEKEEAEKQAKIDERTVTLGNGVFVIGKDLPAGVYDLVAVKGGGNVFTSDHNLNLIMGVKGEEDFYQREYQNAALKDGVNIELDGVTLKFIPDDGYALNN